MRAINLMPADSRRNGLGAPTLGQLRPIHVLLGLLVIALAYVTLYVLTTNTISNRQAHLASVRDQVTQAQAEISQLNRYTAFEQLAQQRATTVKEIAASRFDWHGALTDLSKVVPANTSLQSLVATAAPGSGVSGGGGSTGSSVRGAINAPAFEIRGCTGTQDDVARLMSRLRLINGVVRVTLEDSTKGGTNGAAAAVSAASSGSGSGGCSGNAPTFDLVVFFQQLAPALPAAGTAQSVASPSPTSPAGASASASGAAGAASK